MIYLKKLGTSNIKNLGNLSNLSQILKKTKVDEVILAIEKESNSFEQILYELDYYNIITKIIPKKIDLLSGNVKMSSIHAFPFTEILPSSMSQLESFLKRLFDIIISVFSSTISRRWRDSLSISFATAIIVSSLDSIAARPP